MIDDNNALNQHPTRGDWRNPSSSGILVISLLGLRSPWARCTAQMLRMRETHLAISVTFDWETWVAWTLHRSIWSWTSVPSLRQNLGLDAKSENLGTYFWGAGWYEHEQYATPFCPAFSSESIQIESKLSHVTMGHVEPRWKSRQATVLRVYSDNLWILREGHELSYISYI